ncbi:hypothetical protein [Aeromonas sp. MR16]|jgi:hypothetical protein|uniref:hypothetical protein n=1 Tax=Aeromonas sp. MR16 TaxID=2923420 RepID=UPI001F4B618B|nr:hypothetical protein [Aeromonas sp. MR16]MCH7373234.1 hypothetical protein [Aeromonas sp. MR16]
MKHINQVRKYSAQVVRKYAGPATVVVGAVFASSSAFAVDLATTFAAARATAEANMDLILVGVFSLALIGFGAAHLLGWTKK